MKIDIGTIGITRDGKRITIESKLVPGEPGHDAGFQFEGVTEKMGSLNYKTRHYILYREDGTAKDEGSVSSPSDIVRLVNMEATMIKYDQIKTGDLIGELGEDGVIVNGILGGWVISGSFTVSQFAVRNLLDGLSVSRKPVSNECVFVAGSTNVDRDLDEWAVGYFETVLVAHYVGCVGYLTTLTMPSAAPDVT
jgi:hypothetical protein